MKTYDMDMHYCRSAAEREAVCAWLRGTEAIDPATTWQLDFDHGRVTVHAYTRGADGRFFVDSTGELASHSFAVILLPGLREFPWPVSSDHLACDSASDECGR